MSDQRINPGPGWRLLEPGEVVVATDEYFQFGRWKPAAKCSVDKTLTTMHAPYRRRIEPAASQWIPVAEKPLPESGEAVLQYDDGDRFYSKKLEWLGQEDREQIVAYQLIDPFVPPEHEKRERREWSLAWGGSGPGSDFEWHVFTYDERHGTSYVHVREVLPGDVDPDAARKARERCEKVIHGLRENMYSQALAREILAILNGDDA